MGCRRAIGLACSRPAAPTEHTKSFTWNAATITGLNLLLCSNVSFGPKLPAHESHRWCCCAWVMMLHGYSTPRSILWGRNLTFFLLVCFCLCQLHQLIQHPRWLKATYLLIWVKGKVTLSAKFAFSSFHVSKTRKVGDLWNHNNKSNNAPLLLFSKAEISRVLCELFTLFVLLTHRNSCCYINLNRNTTMAASAILIEKSELNLSLVED